MKLAVVANELQKNEFLAKSTDSETQLIWVNDAEELRAMHEVDAVMHLQFEDREEDIEILQDFLPKPVIVHAVSKTVNELKQPFIRINAWPGFLQNEILEVACLEDYQKQAAENIFNRLNRKIEWAPDSPGLVSARVISMIINEAYLALEEEVSSKEEIDTAMKLGTNYPYGPFEWSRLIGLKKIHALLMALSKLSTRYQPAALLTSEANK